MNITSGHITKGGYLKFIAYLQILGIILVVLGHSFHEYPDNQGGASTLFYRSLYSFRMPLFLFISGFLMVYTSGILTTAKTPPVNFILNKTKRLLLPFVILTTITYIPRIILSEIADEPMQLSCRSFILAFVYNKFMPIPFFWFILASFFLTTTSYSLIFIMRKLRLEKLGPILLCCIYIALYFSDIHTTTLFSINEVKRLGVFFAFGCVYALLFDYVDHHEFWTKWWSLLILIVTWGITFYLLENSEWVIVCSLFGILMCISIAKIIEHNNCKFLDHLQGTNYIIFLLSWYCNVASQQILSHFIDLPWWVYSIISLITGIYIPWGIYKILEHNIHLHKFRIIALILGQSFRKKET